MRVSDPLDPNRCTGMAPNGQCMNFAVNERGTCAVCSTNHVAGQKRAEIRNYRLTKFQARVEEFADSDKVKSLREEIGLIRMMIEEVVNRCKDNTELILMSGKISHLVSQAEKLVVSCHKLEQSTGLLLDKTAILQLAGVIIQIISEYVLDEGVMQIVSDKIIESIIRAQPVKELT
jgi:hypothetical protein